MRLVHLVHPALLPSRRGFLGVRGRREADRRVVFVVRVVDSPGLEIAPEAVEGLHLGPRRIDCAQKRASCGQRIQVLRWLDDTEATVLVECVAKTVEEVLIEFDRGNGQLHIRGVVSTLQRTPLPYARRFSVFPRVS